LLCAAIDSQLGRCNSLNLFAIIRRNIMSDFNFNNQLFTELTSEQASTVEGGLTVQLLQLRCLEAGGGSDQVFAEFNGVRSPNQPVFMRKNSVANFAASGSGSSVRVRLRDRSNNNASLGSFRVSTITGRNTQREFISGDGSRYEVSFRAPF
jgi:hypothetical protein